MAWQDDMTIVLRCMTNDLTKVTYTDDTLQQVIVVAAYQLCAEGLEFSQTFAVSISDVTISPDPTDPTTADLGFVNLTTLKAASVIDRGNAVVAAQRAIAVRDGGSSVNLEGVFRSQFALLQKGGWSAAYDQAKLEYLSGNTRLAGAAILTPFRMWAYGGYGTESMEGYLGGYDGGGEPGRGFYY